MTNRREFLKKTGISAAALAAPVSWSSIALAQEMLPARPLPGTDESLPVVGLGNSRAFLESDIPTAMEIVKVFHERGGRYIDCLGVGRFVVSEVAKALGAANDLFLAVYLLDEEEAVTRENIRKMLDITGKEQLDLLQAWPHIAESSWDMMRKMKDEGLTKYIGISRHDKQYYDDMMKVMETGTVDIVQVNYSPMEREAEERIIPMAMDLGIGVNINRPFMNGDYFKLVGDNELPEWAAEFNCVSWAQFALKFILSHPAVNCVITETSNPDHVLDNIGAGYGLMPDTETRERIFAHLKSL
jgi:diketogulonate reductase-like aldo/keto reductase